MGGWLPNGPNRGPTKNGAHKQNAQFYAAYMAAAQLMLPCAWQNDFAPFLTLWLAPHHAARSKLQAHSEHVRHQKTKEMGFACNPYVTQKQWGCEMQWPLLCPQLLARCLYVKRAAFASLKISRRLHWPWQRGKELLQAPSLCLALGCHCQL